MKTRRRRRRGGRRRRVRHEFEFDFEKFELLGKCWDVRTATGRASNTNKIQRVHDH